jgi:predicted chitinase
MRLRELLTEELAPPDTVGGWLYDKLNKLNKPATTPPTTVVTPTTQPIQQTKPVTPAVATPSGQSATPALVIKPNSQAKPEATPFTPSKDTLVTVAKKMGITSPSDLSNLLGHASVETASWTSATENLKYSDPDRVRRVFTTNFPTVELAQKYLDLNNPVAFANRAYANTLGNGDEASGDGWKYRGRGYLHITGKENYRTVGAKVHPKDPNIYVNNPELLSTNPIEGAKASVAWFLIKDLKGKTGKQVTVGINGATALKNKERGQAAKAEKKLLTKTPTNKRKNTG